MIFNKKEIIIILFFIISIFSITIIKFDYNKNEKPLIEATKEIEATSEQDNSEKAEETKVEEPESIIVDICGAVHSSGIVVLNQEARVYDAVNKAGGLTEKADIKRINLARKISDGEKIIIPEIGEVIDSNHQDVIDTDSRVNINTATIEELQTLNGIGPVYAKRIVEYRESNNGFKKIEDIMNVNGIGEKRFEGIRDSIKVD